jgi:uncharacterized OsmC-like protein
MNGESNEKRAEDRAGSARFSPIQLAIAGLGGAVVLVIVLLVVSIL